MARARKSQTPRVMLVAVGGLAPDDDAAHGESMLQAAEASARGALSEAPVEQLPHVAAWRGAHRAVGAKPRRYRNSVEALLRRAESGLPRVNGVTCRRWNWRQGRRTRLHEDSTAALFILDALEPISSDALRAAVDDLVDHLRRLGPSVRVAERLITADSAA